MTAEQMVKSVFPEARRVYSDHTGKYMIYFEKDDLGPSDQKIAWQNSPAEAWEAAANFVETVFESGAINV